MERQQFSEFKSGMDRRYSDSDRANNGLYDLLNCYVSPRNRIQKRPGIRNILNTQLDATTVGLWPFNLRLWTLATADVFAGQIQPPASDDPEVWTLVLEHGKTANFIHYVGVLLGGLYIVVEFDELTPAVANAGMGAQAVQKGVIEHYYVVTDASGWEPNSVFTKVSPVGLRVVPTAAIDEAAKVIRLDYYYEATELNSPQQGGIEPTWPTSAGATVNDGDLIWNTVTLHERLNTAETFSYHIDGVYCMPTEQHIAKATTRAYRAINIREGDTLNASTNRTGKPPSTNCSSRVSRVVPATSVTIDLDSPNKAFIKELLPTFGRPRIKTLTPSRNARPTSKLLA